MRQIFEEVLKVIPFESEAVRCDNTYGQACKCKCFNGFRGKH